jgi:hypothetical protein
MIKSAVFENEEKLNAFISEQDVKIISINEITIRVDTGLPLLRGGTFYTEVSRLKVWYQTT